MTHSPTNITTDMEVVLRSESGKISARRGWPCVRLSSIVTPKSGNGNLIKGKLSNVKSEGLYPAYSASGQDVFCDSWKYEGPGIVVSAVGARCGKCFLAGGGKWQSIANTHVIIVDEEKALTEYIFELINDENFWIKGKSAQPYVDVKRTLHKHISLPSLEVQKSIVDLLQIRREKIDDIDCAAKLQIREIDALEGAIISETLNEKIVSRSLKDLLDELKDTVGDEWESYPLYGVSPNGIVLSKSKIGGNPEKYKVVESGTIYFRPWGIQDKNVCLVDDNDPSGAISPAYVAIRSASEEINVCWFYHWMRSSQGIVNLMTVARGDRMAITYKGLSSLTVKIPSRKVQDGAVAKLQCLKSLRRKFKARLDEVNTLRQVERRSVDPLRRNPS